MTHPENNFFRTFEIEFSSKNRHFWLVIKFHTLLKNYHFVQKSKVFGKRNKLFEIKFPTKVVILKNCRFDTKKRVLAWISLKYIFFLSKITIFDPQFDFYEKLPFWYEKSTFLAEMRYCFWFSLTFESHLSCIYFNVLTWIFSPKPNRIFFQFEVFTFLITKKCLF